MPASFVREEPTESIHFYQVVFAASIFFLIGFWLHHPNLVPNNYSDVVDALWGRISSSNGIVPYVNYDLEYPALSGIVLYFSSIWGNVYGYYYTLSLIIYSFILLSIYLVYRILALPNKSLHNITYYIIFTPTFIYFSIYSFDWMGASLLLLSIYYALTQRARLSGLFMGLSVAARIIPIVCLPFIVREFPDMRRRMMVIIAASLAWLLSNIYFMIANFEGFLYTYTFQAAWVVEDSWLIIFPSLNLSKAISGALLLGILSLILLWRRRRFDLLEASFLALLGFVLVSFKFPPQYMILLLPFFALLRTNYILFMIANILNIMIILWWFTPSFNLGIPWTITSPVQWLAIARQIVLLPIFISLFRLHAKD
jgi:hypothetical protein